MMVFLFLFFVNLYGGAYEAESMLMTPKKTFNIFYLLDTNIFFAEQNTHFLAEGLHGEFLLYMCF